MNEKYWDRVAEHILPLSESDDVIEAAKEWFWKGKCLDTGGDDHDCEFCGHRGIRWQYEIINQKTGYRLDTGSVCIRRYKVRVFDANGRLCDTDEDKEAAFTAGKKAFYRDVVFEALDAVKDGTTGLNPDGTVYRKSTFPADSFKKTIRKRGGLSPNQAKWFLSLLTKPGAYPLNQFPPEALTIMLSRDKEKKDVEAMSAREFGVIRPYLTKPQRERIYKRGWQDRPKKDR